MGASGSAQNFRNSEPAEKWTVPHMTAAADRRPAAVCFDGFGTLFELGDGAPARALCGRLRELGYGGDEAAVAAGLRAEFPYYRSRHKFVRNRAQLEALQGRCGQIVLDALGPKAAGITPLAAGQAIAAIFPPRLYPETRRAVERVRRAGRAVGVLSNYSFVLPQTLRELGIDSLFDFVVVSALEGVAKPDPEIFAIARRGARVGSGPIAHIGNSHEEDYVGAQQAGFEAVLLDRAGTFSGSGVLLARDLEGALELLF